MHISISAEALSQQLISKGSPARPVNVIFQAAALGLDEGELDRIADEIAQEQERASEH